MFVTEWLRKNTKVAAKKPIKETVRKRLSFVKSFMMNFWCKEPLNKENTVIARNRTDHGISPINNPVKYSASYTLLKIRKKHIK